MVILRTPGVLGLCCLLLLISSASCNSISSRDQQQRDEKTREEAAKATERIKPELKEAGKELGQAARQAAEDAKAAAEGVKEGWNRDHAHPLNLNSASESELLTLPGISRTDAGKIIRGRPYHSKRELVSRGILSDADYTRIRDDVSTD
jgi:DNA uptake protein ComE-like DNA-binding protein